MNIFQLAKKIIIIVITNNVNYGNIDWRLFGKSLVYNLAIEM